ncbi:MAG: hypothetical protein ABFC57_06320 [Veillonellales bacterium]
MEKIEEQLNDLTKVYGPERMLQVCRKLTKRLGDQEVSVVRVELGESCSPDKIKEIIRELDICIEDKLVTLRQLMSEYKAPLSVACPEVPEKYAQLLSPVAIVETMDVLEGTVNEILEREDAYGNKGELLRKKFELEAAIKLTEATAIMNDPAFLGLKNEAMRDAFRREVSAVDRKLLAEVNGQIASIDIAIAKEREVREQLRLAAESTQRKAGLQTALLNFLARGNS